MTTHILFLHWNLGTMGDISLHSEAVVPLQWVQEGHSQGLEEFHLTLLCPQLAFP